MEILTKPLDTFTFLNIQAFAQEGRAEGVQLDYKKDFQSDEKTSQLVAAFANTRGGVIIIGVGENRGTGIPISWDGITEGRHEEHVAQIMSNISPIPAFEVYQTDAVNNKVFVLIRVFEGDETPYYPHNDSNLWIRTGSVKKSIDIASPEAAELLFRKSERAKLARIHNENKATNNYQSYVVYGETQRQKEVIEERERYEERKAGHENGAFFPPFVSQIQKDKVGVNTAMLTILLQPYFPHEDFVRPQAVEQIVQDTRIHNDVYSFPIPNQWESIPNGMLCFDWRGEMLCQQVFANGLVYSSHNILRVGDGVRKTHIGWLTGELFITLKGGKEVWEKIGYQGTLVGTMSIKGLSGAIVEPIVGNFISHSGRQSVFQEHSWSLKIDTQTLADEGKIRDYVTEITKDVHWSFGYNNYQGQITKEYLTQKGYL